MKIKNIKKLREPEITVDIEIEDTHSYQFKNGCISHNTVGALVNSSSGIHPSFSPYYIRTVRADKKDPLYKFMVDKGIPCEDELNNPNHVAVFSFPLKSPKVSKFRDDMTALEQLEFWKLYKTYWCEHNPSVTIYVKENEWIKVAAWVYDNFSILSGISFLPHTEHNYKQAPFQECSKEEYDKLMELMPKEIDWTELINYENDDNTNLTANPACSGNVCEIVDIGNTQ